jgi:cytochrome c553
MSHLSSVWAAVLALGMTASQSSLAEDPHAAIPEAEKALEVTPDPANGAEVYQICSVCHQPEGWGSLDGVYPQIAGQHPEVIIKQLADFRSRNRDNPIMYPFAVPGALGGVQEIADVAAYIGAMPMNPRNGVGPGSDLEYGKQLYETNCAGCHGEQGEGDAKELVPLIQGQHFLYMVRQFEWIRSGKRRNANPKMVEQIMGFGPREVSAVIDYVSRLRPPEEKLAETGWRNPDFGPRSESLDDSE